MASAFDDGMRAERAGMDLLRPHLYGGKPITPKKRAAGVALLVEAYEAYSRDEYLGGRDAGLLDTDSFRARHRDRVRVGGELRTLGLVADDRGRYVVPPAPKKTRAPALPKKQAPPPRRPGVRRRAAAPVVRPAGYGDEEKGKRAGQLRMFNPREEKDNPAAGLTWLPYVEGGKPSRTLKAKTEERSGAYAIRRKDSHGVVYVGESRQGHLWRTIARHFQAPDTFTNPKKPGGANAFATDDGQAYEVAAVVTSKGYRSHEKSDQRALNLQARWIRDFRKAGHRLKNRDDGMSSAQWKAQQAKEKKEEDAGSFEFGANAPREWYENPGGALTFLGLLTRLELASGDVLAWSLKDAPWLAYDARGRLVIAYPRRVARASTPAEIKEYKRSHWGVTPPGKVKDCGFAVGPWKDLGPATSITYTTRKGLDETLVDYVHPFGKRGAGRPRLVEHRCKGGCAASCAAAGSIALAGGSYKMTEHGIVG